MPRSVQAYRQNAVVTNSPANVSNGDPSSAVDDGSNVFQVPPTLDVCAPATGGTRNPFVSGLNTMGSDTGNSTGVAGQTGNIMSGLQMFADTLCGYALGDVSTSQVIEAWRQIRNRNGDPRETYRAMRKLRDAAGGAGTTPQSVIAGVEAVSGTVNGTPSARDAIQTGQDFAGISGNQIIDAVNGSQHLANQSNQLLTGQTTTSATGSGLVASGGKAINQNTANHAANQAQTAATSVNLVNQNLLVSEDFSTAYTVVGDTHWSWDGTDNASSTGVKGCASVACDGQQKPLISSEIPVYVGENIEVSCEVKWSGLVYSGSSPLFLAVEKFRQMKDPAGSGQFVYTDIGWKTVYTIPTPPSASTSVTGNVNGWVGIAGTYTVEPGVDQLRFRLEVNTNASAGTVKWDAAEFLKLDLIPDGAVPGVGNTVDSIVTNLYGTTGSGFTQNQAAMALASTASAVTSVTSTVASLQAEGTTGAIAADDFNFVGRILGGNPNWGGSYSTANDSFGYYQANGVDAVWELGSWPQDAIFYWLGTDATSTTDYQLVQVILDSAPSVGNGFTDLQSYIKVCGRMNGTSVMTRATIGSDGTWVVDYINGGSSFITLASGSGIQVPGTGSVISFYLGDKLNTNPRHYRIEIGTTIIADFNETGTGSPLGSSARGWGWGASCQGEYDTQGRPPKVNTWLATDQ